MRFMRNAAFLVLVGAAMTAIQSRPAAQFGSGTCAINWPSAGNESDACATGTCQSYTMPPGVTIPSCRTLCSQPAPYGCCSGYSGGDGVGCGLPGACCPDGTNTNGKTCIMKQCQCDGVCGGGGGDGGGGGGGDECDGYYVDGYCSAEYRCCQEMI